MTTAAGNPVADGRPAGARALLRLAVTERATPAVAVEVGRRAGVLWREAFGQLRYDPSAAQTTQDTIFDLASLTKVIATSSIAMRAVAAGLLDLEQPVADLAPAWRGPERARVTVRHLLDHSSGLPAHHPFWREVSASGEVEAAICVLPLDQPPGRAAVYSDVGFILLGLLMARALGQSLDALFDPIRASLGPTLGFNPGPVLREGIAPTEFDPWRGRMLQGEVHDENAALLGGIAAHAGLFGTVQDVGAFARLVLATFEEPTVLGTPDVIVEFTRRSSVPGSSRALGWDTMLPTSSCGTKLTTRAIGHTGFTGTSLWIDPALDLYIALLANRVHPTRANDKWPAMRPGIHDAVVAGFAGEPGDG